MANGEVINEAYMKESGSPIEFEILKDAARASCKIKVANRFGSGFFITFNVSPDKEVFGFMTNNHVMNTSNMKLGECFTLHLHNNVTTVIRLINTVDRFTCKLLDATFVELNYDTIKYLEENNVRFLKPNGKNDIKEKMFILQYPKGGNLSFADGFIDQYDGFKIFHKISTEHGSSGSMILSRKGLVEGIHQASWPEKDVNVGIRLECVIEAVKLEYNSGVDRIMRRLLLITGLAAGNNRHPQKCRKSANKEQIKCCVVQSL